ncbi:DUF4383 domain-containing protein, partial [Streptomyces hainanensis]
MRGALGTDPHGEPRLPHSGPRELFRQAVLDERHPGHHRLSRVYRVGAGLMGIGFVIFGAFGVASDAGFFSTGDNSVVGLNSNGALSWLSIVVGALLFGGMVKGGNFASNLSLVLGVLFVLSGFVNLAIVRTGLNFLDFRIQNIIFSFVVGVVLMGIGMYGRISGRLPHDNPYWRARHAASAEDMAVRHEMAEHRRRELNEGLAREHRREPEGPDGGEPADQGGDEGEG